MTAIPASSSRPAACSAWSTASTSATSSRRTDDPGNRGAGHRVAGPRAGPRPAGAGRVGRRPLGCRRPSRAEAGQPAGGQPGTAAGIEVVFGGLAVRAHGLLTVAITGAPAPADIDGTPVPPYAVLTLRPGQVLRLGVPPTGLRSYLAVRGGLEVDPGARLAQHRRAGRAGTAAAGRGHAATGRPGADRGPVDRRRSGGHPARRHRAAARDRRTPR